MRCCARRCHRGTCGEQLGVRYCGSVRKNNSVGVDIGKQAGSGRNLGTLDKLRLLHAQGLHADRANVHIDSTLNQLRQLSFDRFVVLESKIIGHLAAGELHSLNIEEQHDVSSLIQRKAGQLHCHVHIQRLLGGVARNAEQYGGLCVWCRAGGGWRRRAA